MSQLGRAAQRGGGGALQGRNNLAAQRQGSGAYVSLDGHLILGDEATAEVGDSDDPTNTAMFLDESEENELVNVAPGTPLAFKKLGQMTVKSISRQRDSQTPGRPQHSAGRSNIRYDNAESPSKKGRGSHPPLLSSRIPAPPTARAAGRRLAEADDASVPLSVRKIRTSQRAANILDRIKHATPRPKMNGKENAAGAIVDGVLRLDGRAPGQPRTVALEPPLDRAGRLEFVLPRELGAASGTGRHDEPSTPYRMLLALSKDSGQAWEREMGAEHSQPMDGDARPRTPVRQTAALVDVATPSTDYKKRIEGLRQFFCQPAHEAATGATRRNGNMLISFDAPDRQGSDESAALSLQLSQVSSIPNVEVGVDLLQSPSLTPTLTPTQRARDMEGVPRSLRRDPDWGSASSLLLSFTSRYQEQDLSLPVPFVLNKANAPGLDGANANRQADLFGLSSRLNSSICALNHGLREHMARNGAARTGEVAFGAAAGAVEKAGAELNQSLAALAPQTRNLPAVSPGAASASPSELESQLETLRKTMDDTREIMSTIQAQLGQGQARESTKLDDIARLLGALDMRLHMLEDRQRLDQGAGEPAADPGTTPKRANAGSTKVRPASTPSRNLVSHAGQLAVHYLTQYPMVLIGALIVILVSELLVIGGIAPDMRQIRALGGAAMQAVKSHLGPPQPPS
ncbi:hypothetical protein H4R19_003625 [Coemansia spiralis]|nr:hypothetical protein H4R19_003625 [Coemansia spiralis]